MVGRDLVVRQHHGMPPDEHRLYRTLSDVLLECGDACD